MTATSGDLLLRIAAAIKSQIAPAVDDEYTRTQAFMASVIIERIAKQVELAPAHAAAEAADLGVLFARLDPLLAGAPGPVAQALAASVEAATVAGLAPLIESLYRWGPDRADAAAALAAIRGVLRNDIDRLMEIAT